MTVAVTASVSVEQRALLRWGLEVRRDLPWRRTRDPWAIWVSEVMLQQTQAARVVDPWNEFLSRWPTPQACSEATVADLLDVWTGLGYPRRVLALQRGATMVVQRHRGEVPLELGALLELPGVGPYTARAILAFAADADVAVVDTNIARILARRVGRRLTASEAQRAADELLTAGRGWDHNQSLMDVGALLCRPTPTCETCPLSAGCAWRQAGYPEPDPARRSAGVSGRQAPFAGSDRQGRGRLLRAALAGPIPIAQVAEASGWPTEPSRAERVIGDLVREGLLCETAEGFAVPGRD